MLTYGSVCSGIEAVSVAWKGLMTPLWFSEIEPFPCAVLAHHYPDVPNLGDMTALPQKIINREIPAPDVLVGGTPCQAFSVAGLRNSLDDERGNLTLTLIHILEAIDYVRFIDGKQPCVLLWENVPGVLSTKDNAFGTFWLDWLKSVSRYNQQGVSGQTLVMCIRPELSRGESSMLNTSELPNDAVGCLLWQVLDREVSPGYYLSKKAIAYLAKREVRRLPLLLQLKADGDLTIARSLLTKKTAYDGLLRASAKNYKDFLLVIHKSRIAISPMKIALIARDIKLSAIVWRCPLLSGLASE